MHPPRTFFGDIQHGHGSGCSDGHAQPNQRRQGEAGQRGNLEPKGMPRSKMPDHAKSQQKDARRDRGQNDQSHIDNAVDLLAAAATFTAGKMILVVATHLRRQAGNVVTPARQNLAYDGINTLLTHTEDAWVPTIRPTTNGSAPAPQTGLPAARDSETSPLALPAPFLPPSGLSPDGCSAQTDAPAPQTLHYYHSR